MGTRKFKSVLNAGAPGNREFCRLFVGSKRSALKPTQARCPKLDRRLLPLAVVALERQTRRIRNPFKGFHAIAARRRRIAERHFSKKAGGMQGRKAPAFSSVKYG